MSGKMIYLASYPKSGNTWFRTFITNLIKDSDVDFTINKMKTDGIYSNRHMFDNAVGIKASMLDFDEIDDLRPLVYERIARNLKRNLYIKVHDSYTYLPSGKPLLNTVNAKVIYILRNPLDVSVSFANHSKVTLDKSIENMNNPKFCFCDTRKNLANQLRQQLLDWCGHVESYANATELPVHFMQYEDMKLDSFNTFKKAVDFMELDVTDDQVKEAMELSDFKKLRKQEDEYGFKEKPYKVKNFFRKGQVGDWRNHLNEEHVEKLISCHGKTMKKFGYLDDKGQPRY